MTTTTKPIQPPRAGLRINRRWVVYRDFPEVLDIDAATNLPTSQPLTEEMLLDTCRSRDMVCKIWELLTPPRPIIAYSIHRLHRDHTELLRMAVAPQFQGLGVGRMIIEHMKTNAAERRKYLIADVSEYNTPAQLFLRAHGFRARFVVRNYIAEGHDAYEFHYHPAGR